ncbi:piggyBac transposable element-derived protein 4-like [Eriocheir sinensis]|uniref:piggyBac transposable element-derived protein 4-like n=1 Tax=Eriocheir sinensis TaxID=95602 RepID=UPI0021C67D46|nr:piggyBac transposable element-derived protein 4-like [Eriocheir sinensis]
MAPDDYDTSDEEIEADDVASTGDLSGDDSATLTEGSDSSDGDTRALGVVSPGAGGWVPVTGDVGPPPGPFTGASGLKHPPVVMPCPLNILEFFTPDLLDKVVLETNRYARQWIESHVQHLREKKRSVVHSWITQGNTNPREFLAFLAVVMNMRLIRKPTIKSYWDCSSPSQSTPWFREHFNRERFGLMLKFLHFNDNENLPDKTDPAYRLYKIQPLVGHFQRVFQSRYIPGHKLSINESVIEYHGKAPNLRQYMPNKHHGLSGLRVWCLCEAETGYTVTLDVLKGTSHAPASQGAATHDVVMRLLAKADLLHREHHLGLDSYFSSPELFEDLWQAQTTATGTVWVNRKGLPKEAAHLKLGQHQVLERRKGPLLCVAHRDGKKTPVFLSTMAKAGSLLCISKTKQTRNCLALLQTITR